MPLLWDSCKTRSQRWKSSFVWGIIRYTLTSNAGNAAGRELGQSSVALECSLKPSSPGMFPFPKPMGTFLLPSSGVSMLGMQEHPCILWDQQSSRNDGDRVLLMPAGYAGAVNTLIRWLLPARVSFTRLSYKL